MELRSISVEGQATGKALHVDMGLSLEQLLPSKLDYEVCAKLAGRTYRVTLRQRRFDGKPAEYWARTRIYASVPDGVLPDHPPYGSVRGDGSDEDKAWRAFNRLESRTMSALIDAVLPLVLALTASPADLRYAFSRKAGCSCGCSPGFVVRNDFGTLRYLGSPCDIWVSEVTK